MIQNLLFSLLFSLTLLLNIGVYAESAWAEGDDFGDTCAEASPISIDAGLTGSIEYDGDVDVFAVTVPANGELTAYTTGDTDTYGIFLDGNCTEIGADDDSGFLKNFILEQPVNSEKLYHIAVMHFSSTGTGRYTLHVDFSADDDTSKADDFGNTCEKATPIELNSITPGVIGSLGDIDFFHIRLEEPGTVTIYTTGTIDTFGYLKSNICADIMVDDDSGDGYNFRMLKALGSGEFNIAVRHFSTTMTGTYSLHVDYSASTNPDENDEYGNNCAGAFEIEPNTQHTGEINVPGDIDYFRIATPAAGILDVYTTGETDTYGYLKNTGCSDIGADDDSGEDNNFQILRTVGDSAYYIAVRHYGSEQLGYYTLHADFTPIYDPMTEDDFGNSCETAGIAEFATPNEGIIGTVGDVDYFKISVPLPGLLSVYTTGDTDTYGRLHNIICTPILTDDDSGTVNNFYLLNWVEPGTYYVSIRHFSQIGTGPYTLYVELSN